MVPFSWIGAPGSNDRWYLETNPTQMAAISWQRTALLLARLDVHHHHRAVFEVAAASERMR